METASDRRKRKLKQVCDANGGHEKVATKAGLNPFSLDQILKGVLGEPRKDNSRIPRSLGNSAARAIEEAYKLGTGWFDTDEGALSPRALEWGKKFDALTAIEQKRWERMLLAAEDHDEPEVGSVISIDEGKRSSDGGGYRMTAEQKRRRAAAKNKKEG